MPRGACQNGMVCAMLGLVVGKAVELRARNPYAVTHFFRIEYQGSPWMMVLHGLPAWSHMWAEALCEWFGGHIRF
jgi:pimeloyl-ACP methyl ester carboxylesterase